MYLGRKIECLKKNTCIIQQDIKSLGLEFKTGESTYQQNKNDDNIGLDGWRRDDPYSLEDD